MDSPTAWNINDKCYLSVNSDGLRVNYMGNFAVFILNFICIMIRNVLTKFV